MITTIIIIIITTHCGRAGQGDISPAICKNISQADLDKSPQVSDHKKLQNTIPVKSSISLQAPESQTQHLGHVSICKNGQGMLYWNPGRSQWGDHSFSFSWEEGRRMTTS